MNEAGPICDLTVCGTAVQKRLFSQRIQRSVDCIQLLERGEVEIAPSRKKIWDNKAIRVLVPTIPFLHFSMSPMGLIQA